MAYRMEALMMSGTVLTVAIALLSGTGIAMAQFGAPQKRYGEPAELAKKNAGKHATITLAVAGETIGDVVIEFYPEDAPNTVENFIQLAESGFYNGLLFHRVIKGFMIQGGDPDGMGTGGPGWEIPAEFNARSHVPGTLSMARSQDPDSAGSQFFICLGTPTHLDGEYTAFGQVISGQELVQQIGNEAAGRNDRPQRDCTMQTVVINDGGPSSASTE